MKIADFGLARDIHHIDYYKKTTNVSNVTVSPVFCDAERCRRAATAQWKC